MWSFKKRNAHFQLARSYFEVEVVASLRKREELSCRLRLQVFFNTCSNSIKKEGSAISLLEFTRALARAYFGMFLPLSGT